MSGLLGGVLPAIYSQADRAKRYLGGLLSDPVGRMQQAGGQAVDDLSKIGLLSEQAFSDPRNPMKLQNNAAARQLVDTYLNSVLNFAPVGMTVKGPQAEALEKARKNAVKMLGLPENNTPMDRARALGFTDDLLHGGTNDFPAFKVSDRSNVYATDVPAIADIYANATGRHKGLREVNASPNVMPLMYRGKLLEVSDQGPTGGGWLQDNLAEALGTTPRRNLVKEAPSKGYSGVKVTDMDDLGGRQSQYVFPDPTVLRSRFAAFDPARINENDLLGRADPRLLALIGLGAGGAAYYGSDK